MLGIISYLSSGKRDSDFSLDKFEIILKIAIAKLLCSAQGLVLFPFEKKSPSKIILSKVSIIKSEDSEGNTFKNKSIRL